MEPSAYTWEALGSVAGATAATLVIVQYLKVPLDKWMHIPTRLLVFIIALLILGGARGFTAGISPSDIPLMLLNAVVVALAAMGTYEISFARLKGSKGTSGSTTEDE